MAIGEIARFEQFLLLPQLFRKSSAAEASERDCEWERVKENVSRGVRYAFPRGRLLPRKTISVKIFQ